MNDTGTDESASAIEWHGIIKKALERAKNVEELLGLYQQKEKLSKNPYKNIDTKELKPFYEWACEIEELENKIQAIEEELK